MNTVIHKANQRGFADHGWLKAHHSFSFANWFDPEKVQFGQIRVFNDDIIAPGTGFGTHPHQNMEIVTIPLEGSIAHKDNTGHEEVIKPDEIQVMSAGTGILHSEFNASKTDHVNLFQVWILPNSDGHEPRYDQKSFNPKFRKNKIHTFVSPDKSDGNLWLNQEAYFSWCDLDEQSTVDYSVNNKDNGTYILLIDGIIKVADQILTRRDAIGIWETENIELTSDKDSRFVLIETPMK